VFPGADARRAVLAAHVLESETKHRYEVARRAAHDAETIELLSAAARHNGSIEIQQNDGVSACLSEICEQVFRELIDARRMLREHDASREQARILYREKY